MEEWRDIKGYEGYYQVSSQGRIRNTNSGIIMSPHTNCFGYFRVGLSKEGERKTKAVHRLVSEAFIPNPDNLPEVNHKDENKGNNTVENLEWCTRKYNMSYGTGRKRAAEKESKSIAQITLDGEIINIFPSIHEAARKTNIDYTFISHCAHGKNKTCKGYKWEFIS